MYSWLNLQQLSSIHTLILVFIQNLMLLYVHQRKNCISKVKVYMIFIPYWTDQLPYVPWYKTQITSAFLSPLGEYRLVTVHVIQVCKQLKPLNHNSCAPSTHHCWVKCSVTLVIANGHFSLPLGLCGYLWEQMYLSTTTTLHPRVLWLIRRSEVWTHDVPI